MNKLSCPTGTRARRCLPVAALLCATLLAACGGGGGITPSPSVISGIAFGTAQARLYAKPGSADAGSTVSATGGGTGTTAAAADGSFTLTVSGAGGSGTLVTVQYVKGGAQLTTSVTLTTLDASVNPDLFATGSAPNDILLSGETLYVANSLDNTVVAYSPDTGAAGATHTFPVASSPSYLSQSGNAVWVAANGDNTVTGLKASDLTTLVGSAFQLTEPGTAFIGPMEPLLVGTLLYVPRNEIASFGPTAYGQGLVTAIDISGGGKTDIATKGDDPQCCAYDNTRSILYVVTAGDIEFDANFVPSAATDSYLEAYDTANHNIRIGAVDLGKVGAGRMALSRDGKTAYLGNALTGDVFKVDLQSMAVLRGQSHPIHLTDAFTYVSDVEFTPDYKYLLATSFNTDELYVIDPATDTVNPGPYPTPFNLRGSSNLLSGAARIAIAPDPTGSNSNVKVYVLLGVANAVAKVDL